MSTIKLNKTMREEIAKDLTRKLEEKKNAINAEGSHLAKMLYEEMLTPKERDLLNSLPEGWVPTFDAFYVKCPTNGRFNRIALKLDFREPHPWTFNTRPNLVDLESCPKFKAAFLEWHERYSAARETEQDARRKALTVLNSVTTVNRLLEVWPECRASVERCVSESRTVGKAIAVPVGELNSLLELPEEAVAA